MSARWWFESLREMTDVSDSWNFRHGDVVTLSGTAGTALDRAVVHAPRWWDLVAHVRWAIAKRRRRATLMTLTNGTVLRLVLA